MTISEPFPGIAEPGNTYPGESDLIGNGQWAIVNDPEVIAGVLNAYGKTSFSATVNNSTVGRAVPVNISGFKGVYSGSYFDGGSPLEGFVPAWQGTPFNSKSLLQAPAAPGVDYTNTNGVIATLSTQWAGEGVQSLRLIPSNVRPGNNVTTLDLPTLTVGQQYTISVMTRLLETNSEPPFIALDPLRRAYGSTSAGDTKIVLTFVATTFDKKLEIAHGGVHTDGDVFIDDISLQLGSASTFFWGEYPDNVDFSYLWDGAENASPTTKRSLQNVKHVTGVNAVPVLSSVWRVSRTSSMRVVNTHKTLPGKVKVIDLSLLEMGKTYTVSVVVMSMSGMPLTEPPYKSVVFENNISNVSRASRVGVGSERLILAFTVTEGMTTGGVYLYNGGVVGDPDVWFDELMIVEGVTTDHYFDGFGRGNEWLGEPNESRSRRNAVEYSTGGWPLKKFYSAMGDQLGKLNELVERFTYIPEDDRNKDDEYGYLNQGRQVPLGATSDLVDARTADDDWLPWIGQLTGVKVEKYKAGDELRRAVMESDSGFHAGSKSALIASVKTVLLGDWEDRQVQIYPNSTSLTTIGKATTWDLLIVTRTLVSPPSADIIRAIELSGAKPAGIKLHHATFEATWDDVEGAYPTWTDWENAKTWQKIEDAGF